MRVPNMTSELLEAVHYWFEDNPEVEIDVLVFLANLGCDKLKLAMLSMRAEQELVNKDRCPRCGCPMEYETHREWHSEVEGYEPVTERYCPQCDRGDE